MQDVLRRRFPSNNIGSSLITNPVVNQVPQPQLIVQRNQNIKPQRPPIRIPQRKSILKQAKGQQNGYGPYDVSQSKINRYQNQVKDIRHQNLLNARVMERGVPVPQIKNTVVIRFPNQRDDDILPQKSIANRNPSKSKIYARI